MSAYPKTLKLDVGALVTHQAEIIFRKRRKRR